MKMRGANCEPTKLKAGIVVWWGGVGREAWSAIRIIQRKSGLLEYEGDVRRRPGVLPGEHV